jgi:hypothetical protein
LHGLDVLIDDNYNTYFIDYNSAPEITYKNLEYEIKEMLKTFYFLMYQNFKNILNFDKET